jgi:hypothetical protein
MAYQQVSTSAASTTTTSSSAAVVNDDDDEEEDEASARRTSYSSLINFAPPRSESIWALTDFSSPASAAPPVSTIPFSCSSPAPVSVEPDTPNPLSRAARLREPLGLPSHVGVGSIGDVLEGSRSMSITALPQLPSTTVSFAPLMSPSAAASPVLGSARSRRSGSAGENLGGTGVVGLSGHDNLRQRLRDRVASLPVLRRWGTLRGGHSGEMPPGFEEFRVGMGSGSAGVCEGAGGARDVIERDDGSDDGEEGERGQMTFVEMLQETPP